MVNNKNNGDGSNEYYISDRFNLEEYKDYLLSREVK